LKIASGKPKPLVLPVRDFLGHVENQLAILVIGLAQQAAKLVEVAGFFAGAAPCDVVRRTLRFGRSATAAALRRRRRVIERDFEWRASFSSVSMAGTVWPFSTREI